MRNTFQIRKEFPIRQWTGGSTTELFLYPENGDYTSRDFLFRVSSATVQESPSVFTQLPGIQRTIMLLDGTMQLCHGDKEKVILEPGTCHDFSGEEKTVSTGTATDFNLMVQEGAKGTVEYLFLLAGDRENYVVIPKDGEIIFTLLYVCQGNVLVENGYERQKLCAGELGILKLEQMTEVHSYVLENPEKNRAKVIRTVVCVQKEV